MSDIPRLKKGLQKNYGRFIKTRSDLNHYLGKYLQIKESDMSDKLKNSVFDEWTNTNTITEEEVIEQKPTKESKEKHITKLKIKETKYKGKHKETHTFNEVGKQGNKIVVARKITLPNGQVKHIGKNGKYVKVK